MTFYSVVPLAKKLGIKEGFRIYIKNAPLNYLELISPIPENVSILKRISSKLDLVHLFTKKQSDLVFLLIRLLPKIKQNGMIWVSWPKKASKVPTDITENVVRETALSLGLVDVKVCTVDNIWSGLKLVIRRVNRK